MSLYKPGVYTPEPFYVEGDPLHSDLKKRKSLYLSLDTGNAEKIKYYIRVKPGIAFAPAFLCLMSAAIFAGIYYIRSLVGFESEPAAWLVMTFLMVLFLVIMILLVIAVDFTLKGKSSIEADRNYVSIKKTLRGHTITEKSIPVNEITDIRIADRPARAPYRVVEIRSARKKIVLGESVLVGPWQEDYLYYIKDRIENATGREFPKV